jgi:hypothetical protein
MQQSAGWVDSRKSCGKSAANFFPDAALLPIATIAIKGHEARSTQVSPFFHNMAIMLTLFNWTLLKNPTEKA